MVTKKCKNCKGSGYVQIGPNIRGIKKCPYCNGTGFADKRKKLTDYIYEKYADQVDKSEWFVNPAPNQFKGYFPELRKLITFTCGEDGTVTEDERILVSDPELWHEIVYGCSRGMDAVYEEYVSYLIGVEGLWTLRRNGVLESCGTINGRRLYTVKNFI